MTHARLRTEPCTNCGAEVEEIYAPRTGVRPGPAQKPSHLVGIRHADATDELDPVDDQCTRGQYGPTADYGDG